MMKTKKTLISLVLVLSMVLSVNIVPSAAKETEEKELYCSMSVYTPYQDYYCDPDFPYNYNPVVLTSESLKDDFGIGLSTDGGQGFTLSRALACLVRGFIMSKDNLSKEEANKEMKKYMDVSFSEYGFFLNHLSPDGSRWDVGTVDGPADAKAPDGSWMVYVNGKMTRKLDGKDVMVGWEDDLSTYKEDYLSVDVVWYPYSVPGSGYGFFEETNDFKKTVIGANEKASLTLVKEIWDMEKNDYATVPVTGASVRVFSQTQEAYSNEMLTTDDSGKVTFNGTQGGIYKLIATENVTENGATFSKISPGLLTMFVVDPVPAKNVKAKAKKKTIKVSWKNGAIGADATTVYQVYLSKKKASGFKKAATGDGIHPSAKFKVKKKGTYYVKIKTLKYVTVSIESKEPEYKIFKSGFTAPVKVKVK